MVYRIAILTGDTARLTACSAHHYTELTARSYKAAVVQALRLNGLVIGWRQAK